MLAAGGAGATGAPSHVDSECKVARMMCGNANDDVAFLEWK